MINNSILISIEKINQLFYFFWRKKNQRQNWKLFCQNVKSIINWHSSKMVLESIVKVLFWNIFTRVFLIFFYFFFWQETFTDSYWFCKPHFLLFKFCILFFRYSYEIHDRSFWKNNEKIHRTKWKCKCITSLQVTTFSFI